MIIVSVEFSRGSIRGVNGMDSSCSTGTVQACGTTMSNATEYDISNTNPRCRLIFY